MSDFCNNRGNEMNLNWTRESGSTDFEQFKLDNEVNNPCNYKISNQLILDEN